MIGYFFVGALLVGIGLFGALTQKNIIRIFIAVEIMITGANLLLVALLVSNAASDANPAAFVSRGLVLLFLVWLFAAANAVVGLSLFLLLRNKARTQRIDSFTQLKG